MGVFLCPGSVWPSRVLVLSSLLLFFDLVSLMVSDVLISSNSLGTETFKLGTSITWSKVSSSEGPIEA